MFSFSRRGFPLLLLFLLLVPVTARAEEDKKENQTDEPPPRLWYYGQYADPDYHTPLAGDALDIELFGLRYSLEERSRRYYFAFNAGSTFFQPKIADESFVPFGALFYKQHWRDDRRRLRVVFTGMVNDILYEDGTWNDRGFEVVGTWANSTIPFPRSEVIEGRELEVTEAEWGWSRAGIGMGWYHPVYPYEPDNAFRVQLLYEPEYFYVKRSDLTGPTVHYPPDTFVHRLHLRLRYDGLLRNIMELPHEGVAFGGDVVAGTRDRWETWGLWPKILFEKQETKDFLRLSAFAMVATGIPLLSERHRLVASVDGVWTPPENADRFSAPRLGGGPPSTESNDLSRHPFPGALFDQFITERHLLLSVEYRLELLFFLYLHVRGSLVWGRFFELDPSFRLEKNHRFGTSVSAAITTGFVWDSQLYLEWAYEDSVVRTNDEGHSFLISWSKSF